MMRQCFKYYLLSVLLFSVISVNAAHIHGTAKDYANFELVFFSYSDFLTEKTDTLFTLRIDGDGQFDQQFDLDEIKPVYTLVGIYKIWFIAEPDGDYELVFPDYVEKTKAEIYNPFFQPILLMAGMKGKSKDDLNYMINAFEYDYNAILNTHLLDFISQGKEANIDLYIDTLQREYMWDKSEYFNAWKKFRYATMRRIAYERNHRYTINHYFSKDDVHYQNPAYMNLFLELFANYFDRFLLRPDGKELVAAIDKGKSPYLISKVLSRMFELSDQRFREFVIIKGLQDAYLGENFRPTSVLIALDSIAGYSKYPEHRKIAANVIADLRYMKSGTVPPDFTYLDSEGNSRKLSENRNRYLYIAFYQSELSSCIQEIAVLKELAIKHEGEFDVLFIVFDEDKQKAMNNLARYDLPFDVYFPKDPDVLKAQWEILTFPTYYLVGTDGRLVFSPAPAPTEYFENYFFRYVRR